MPSDDAELAKAVIEGAVEGAMKPFSNLLEAIFGPASVEAGLMLKDSVQYYRFKRRVRFFQQTQKALADAGIKPTHVPLKILLPIIENASNEEDDNLQDLWANLLANAADPAEENEGVYPAFPSILKELTAQDAKFLDSLFKTASVLAKGGAHYGMEVYQVKIDPRTVSVTYKGPQRRGDGRATPEEIRAEARAMHISLDTFERQGVFVKVYGDAKSDEGTNTVGIAYSFTSLGTSFVMACRAPRSRV